MAIAEVLQAVYSKLVTRVQAIADMHVVLGLNAQLRANQSGVEFAQWRDANEEWKKKVEGLITNNAVHYSNRQDTINAQMISLVDKIGQLERGSVGQWSDATRAKEKLQLTRPKDMDSAVFSGKDGEWMKWKEEMEDYVDAVQMGLKDVLGRAASVKSPLLERTQIDLVQEEWDLHTKLFVLLKRMTSGEARSLVMCVEKQNGFEAWRLLVGGFEPQAGIRRMKEIAELMTLQNKRCKNFTETSMVLLELDRGRPIVQ